MPTDPTLYLNALLFQNIKKFCCEGVVHPNCDITDHDDDSNIVNHNVRETIIPEVPPWTLHHPKVC